MKVRFDKKWFNPLYFILNDIIKDNNIRTVFVYGGKSSSKTVSLAQIIGKECFRSNSSAIAFRKESTTIPTTLKKSFNLALETTRLYPAFARLDRMYKCVRGGEIVLKGLDEEEKAKGVEGYKYVYCDELNHFLKGEWEQIGLSLRGIEGQKLFGSWNPVDENSWIKTDVIDKQQWFDVDKWKLPCEDSFVRISEDGKTVLIKTTYSDNYWIVGSPCGTYGYRDENLIHEYNKLKERNYNSYKVNVLGEWGKTNFGGEILKSWDSSVHAKRCEYRKNDTIYLSFDENVNPYFPCGIFQVGEDCKSPKMIDIITARNPNNTTKWMGREISRKLREWNHKGRVYITGDATSKKADVKIEKGHDLFRIMQKELEAFNPIVQVGKSNPSVITSTDFFNAILRGDIEGLSFGVDDKCRAAIQDFENTKEDRNGHVDKSLVRDPVTKISYQPYGHIFDLTRYFLTNVYNSEYLAYQGSGILPTITSGVELHKRSSRF